MKINTSHPLSEFISSQKKVDLKERDQIINLGQLLIKNLEDDRDVWVLSRWIAYYIAEQMERAKKLKGKNKIEAEKLCFESILKLWAERESIPREKRPLEKFEQIFEIIKSINPDTDSPFYFTRKSTDSLPKDISAELKDWLKTIEAIDAAARVWINYCLNIAFSIASDDDTVKWIENAYDLYDSGDIKIINSFLNVVDNKKESEEEKKEKQRVSLQNRIDKLDVFIDFSMNLRDSYLNDLDKLNAVSN